MQKLINVLSVLSFVGVAGIVGGGTYLYLQRDAIIDGVKEQVTKHATEAITSDSLVCWMVQCLNYQK